MRVLIALCGLMAGAALMLSAPALAASQTDRDQCADLGNRAAADQNIAACTRLLEVDPKDAGVYVDRGTAYAAQRDYDRAIADFDAAIALNPALAMAYNNRGVARRLKGDATGAIADYGEAIRLAPDLAMAYRNRGRARHSKDEYDAALADFDAAIRLDPNDAGSFASRCWARAVAGRDLAQALADCDESLRLRPGDTDTLNSRGLVQLKRGALDRAAADYAAAVARDEKDADSRFGRGIARLRLGDLAGGQADIAAAEAIRPGIAEAYVGYGVAAVASVGQPAEAVPAAAPAPVPAQRDYELAAQIGTRAAWEAFLKAYPAGFHADLARAQLDKLGVAAPEVTAAVDRDRAEQEKRATERLAREQAERLEQERRARELADRARVAAPVLTTELAPPPPLAAPQLPPPLSGGALVKEIKKGLTELGCYSGPIDDKWRNESTRSAVKKFVAAVHLATATDKPTQDLLDAMRGTGGRVCSLACGPGEVKRKGDCVAKTCRGKLVLDDAGNCVKPDDTTRRAAIPLPRPAPASLAKRR